MAELVLQFPVTTLEGRELLPAGVTLTAEVMKQVTAGGKGAEYLELMRHGRIRHDLLELLNLDPFRKLFRNEAETSELLEFLGQVRQPRPCLDALDFFCEHDFSTYRHVLMVFALTALLARDLLPDHHEQLRQTFASPTHDIGKICIPLPILKKQVPLVRGELERLHHHSAAGYVLLAHFHGDASHPAALVARDHHERRNGSGYPRGITCTDPLVEIIAVCDIYDALISPRPYRPVSFENRTAIEEITRIAEAGEIGWAVVKALVARNRGVPFDWKEVWVSSEKRGLPPAGNLYGLLNDD